MSEFMPNLIRIMWIISSRQRENGRVRMVECFVGVFFMADGLDRLES